MKVVRKCVIDSAINSINNGFNNAYKIGFDTLFVIATLKMLSAFNDSINEKLLDQNLLTERIFFSNYEKKV